MAAPRLSERPRNTKIGRMEAHYHVNLFRGRKVKRKGHRVTRCKSIAAAYRYAHLHICRGSLKEQPFEQPYVGLNCFLTTCCKRIVAYIIYFHHHVKIAVTNCDIQLNLSLQLPSLYASKTVSLSMP